MNSKLLSSLLSGLLCLALMAGCSETSTNAQASLPGSPPTASAPAGAASETQPVNKTIGNTGDGSIQAVSLEPSTGDYYFDWKAGSYTTVNLENGSNTITKSGVYELTGTLSDGSVTVDIDKLVDEGTVFLIVNNANINSASSTPINIIEAKKAVLILENGTTNTVTQGSITTTDENFPDAAIFSKADMTITGGGTLNVTTEYNDGITGKDDLIITDGIINIKAVGDGISGKDLLAVENATIQITSGKDGMRSTNDTDEGKGNLVISSGNVTINAVDDAIHAENTVSINGGDIQITNCYEGIEGINIIITSGKISVVSVDDGLNVSAHTGAMEISGGELYIESGGDAVDSNGDLTITGGEITINTSTISQGNGTLDYDGTATFTGGTITDQNGNAIDPTVRSGPGGMGGGGGRGDRVKPAPNN